MDQHQRNQFPPYISGFSEKPNEAYRYGSGYPTLFISQSQQSMSVSNTVQNHIHVRLHFTHHLRKFQTRLVVDYIATDIFIPYLLINSTTLMTPQVLQQNPQTNKANEQQEAASNNTHRNNITYITPFTNIVSFERLPDKPLDRNYTSHTHRTYLYDLDGAQFPQF